MRWVERVCVNLECMRSRLAEDLHSLAGAVGNRAEVNWRNSARWLEHKPSELSTPAELRGLDRFSLKCERKNATFCKNVAARGPFVR